MRQQTSKITRFVMRGGAEVGGGGGGGRGSRGGLRGVWVRRDVIEFVFPASGFVNLACLFPHYSIFRRIYLLFDINAVAIIYGLVGIWAGLIINSLIG